MHTGMVKSTFAVLWRSPIERSFDGSWRVLFRCGWSAPTCPGRSVKILIGFFVFMNKGPASALRFNYYRLPALAAWCVHEHRPTGEARPSRPTD